MAKQYDYRSPPESIEDARKLMREVKAALTPNAERALFYNADLWSGMNLPRPERTWRDMDAGQRYDLLLHALDESIGSLEPAVSGGWWRDSKRLALEFVKADDPAEFERFTRHEIRYGNADVFVALMYDLESYADEFARQARTREQKELAAAFSTFVADEARAALAHLTDPARTARLRDALQGALYALDEDMDGYGPSRRTAVADARAALAADPSSADWRRAPGAVYRPPAPGDSAGPVTESPLERVERQMRELKAGPVPAHVAAAPDRWDGLSEARKLERLDALDWRDVPPMLRLCVIEGEVDLNRVSLAIQRLYLGEVREQAILANHGGRMPSLTGAILADPQSFLPGPGRGRDDGHGNEDGPERGR